MLDKKSTKFTLLAILFSFALTTASALQLPRATLGCVSEEIFDELLGYVGQKDYNGINQLINTGQCISLRPNTTVSVISNGFMIATIRYILRPV